MNLKDAMLNELRQTKNQILYYFTYEKIPKLMLNL